MSKKSSESAEIAARNALSNIDALSQESAKQTELNKNDASQIYTPPQEHKPTLFMLNNNMPQESSYEPYMKDVKAYNKKDASRSRYGVAALIFAGIALVCAVILIVAMVISQPNGDSASGVMAWLVLTILAPTLGLFGSVICALISAVVGIVGLCKAHNRVLSWVGFFVGLIVLAGVIITAGIYLF